jgi:hypothetical protein
MLFPWRGLAFEAVLTMRPHAFASVDREVLASMSFVICDVRRCNLISLS